MDEIIIRLRTNAAAADITLFPPATVAQISHFESVIGVPLPADIWLFYSFSNGMDTLDLLFRIIPLDEIIQYGMQFGPFQFSFAEYMIYSDSWEIKLDPDARATYSIHNEAIDAPLTGSLATFLERYLANGLFGGGGIYDWHDEITSGGNKLK